VSNWRSAVRGRAPSERLGQPRQGRVERGPTPGRQTRGAGRGYRIESQTDTEATLVMKGHRRWFGMVGGNTETRQITSVDEQARTRTRRPA
jgi:hypothetical protein